MSFTKLNGPDLHAALPISDFRLFFLLSEGPLGFLARPSQLRRLFSRFWREDLEVLPFPREDFSSLSSFSFFFFSFFFSFFSFHTVNKRLGHIIILNLLWSMGLNWPK